MGASRGQPDDFLVLVEGARPLPVDRSRRRDRGGRRLVLPAAVASGAPAEMPRGLRPGRRSHRPTTFSLIGSAPNGRCTRSWTGCAGPCDDNGWNDCPIRWSFRLLRGPRGGVDHADVSGSQRPLLSRPEFLVISGRRGAGVVLPGGGLPALLAACNPDDEPDPAVAEPTPTPTSTPTPEPALETPPEADPQGIAIVGVGV